MITSTKERIEHFRAWLAEVQKDFEPRPMPKWFYVLLAAVGIYLITVCFALGQANGHRIAETLKTNRVYVPQEIIDGVSK